MSNSNGTSQTGPQAGRAEGVASLLQSLWFALMIEPRTSGDWQSGARATFAWFGGGSAFPQALPSSAPLVSRQGAC